MYTLGGLHAATNQTSTQVLESNRAEESQSHVHRMYFMGPNSFGEPWHLPHSPPDQIIQLVYEDAFNRFVDEINSLAAYQWWEGSVYSILSVLAYPFAWSWQQWRRRKKVERLREFVRSEYDHACLRSCRSRALYEGLKMVALICGFFHYKFQPSSNGGPKNLHAWNFSTEESGWWLFPIALLLCKCVQALMVDWHIANLEIQDHTLYSNDPAEFWES